MHSLHTACCHPLSWEGSPLRCACAVHRESVRYPQWPRSKFCPPPPNTSPTGLAASKARRECCRIHTQHHRPENRPLAETPHPPNRERCCCIRRGSAAESSRGQGQASLDRLEKPGL